MEVLIRFTHGLGDAVQLTVVLKHLAKYRPDWQVDVWGLVGKHTAWRGLCRAVYSDRDPAPGKIYQQVFELGWHENYNGYPDRPNSKVTNCLADVFGIPYDSSLARYHINITDESRAASAEYLASIGCVRGQSGRFNSLVIHYQGNTSTAKKNLGHEYIGNLCHNAIHRKGMVPVILDWDNRSPWPDRKAIFCPRPGGSDLWHGTGTGDAERIAALIDVSSAFLGIDSGPGKCASATDTPTCIVWTGHHPIQFHDPAPNTYHLVPSNHRGIPPVATAPAAGDYFERHYRFRTYGPGGLAGELFRFIEDPHMSGTDDLFGFEYPPGKRDQAWVIVQDVYCRDAYKTYLRPKKSGVEYVLDVGANIGTFSRLWKERNPDAVIAGVEVIPELAAIYSRNCPYATAIHAACGRPGEMLLLDATAAGGQSIGGSRVVSRDEYDREGDPQYTKRPEPVQVLSLEQIRQRLGWPRIDVLKLDCEGSEFAILEEADLSKIGTIFAESHGAKRWDALIASRFSDWHKGHMSQHGEFGNWHLVNPVSA